MEGNGEDRHAREKKGLIEIIVIVALICVAVVASVIYGIQVYKERREEERMAQLAALNQMYADMGSREELDIQAPEPGDLEEPEPDPMEILIEMGVPIPEKEVDIAALQEEVNKDIYAWIYIPDSDIDYPVLSTDED